MASRSRRVGRSEAVDEVITSVVFFKLLMSEPAVSRRTMFKVWREQSKPLCVIQFRIGEGRLAAETAGESSCSGFGRRARRRLSD